MRIAHIICTFPPYKGGMGNSACHLARVLAQSGHEVVVFTPDYGSHDSQAGIGSEAFKVVRLKPWLKSGNAALLPQFMWQLKGFDVVHLHYPFYGAAEFVLLGKILAGDSMKLVLHYHMDSIGSGLKGLIFNLGQRFVLPRLVKRSEHVICASTDYIQNSGITGLFKKYQSKFINIAFGVDLNRFKHEEGRSEEPVRTILFVAALDKAHYFKGLENLLKATAKLDNDYEIKEKGIRFKLNIVGDGDLRSHYEQAAKDLKLSSKVFFLGRVDDDELARQYSRCYAFVLPSINQGEAFGLVLLEAMASGRPVIASSLPGVRSVFNDGVEGLQVKPGDINDLFNKLKTILLNETAARAMGESGRKLVLEKYTWEKIGERLSELYKSTLKKSVDSNNPHVPVIGIDASRWEDPRYPGEERRTGVEVYTKNLIENLIPLINESGLRVRLYTPRLIKELPAEIQKIIPGRRHWTYRILNRELRTSPVDYFFTPSYFIPRNAPAKSFTTVHDVIYKTNPENYSFYERLSQNYAGRKNVQRSSRIITVSQFSKDEIAKAYRINKAKIEVAPIGHDAWQDIDRNRSREKMILFVGRVEKKKSVDLLIKAFASFNETNPGWRLVIAGKPGYGFDAIKNLIGALKLEQSVSLTGYISEGGKKDYLTRASLFVHPSSNEGSCIPLFEAWDARTPAIVADNKILKEIGREGALYFKAGDAIDLATKLNELAASTELQTSLKHQGQKNLEEMSWRKTAAKVLEIILKD